MEEFLCNLHPTGGKIQDCKEESNLSIISKWRRRRVTALLSPFAAPGSLRCLGFPRVDVAAKLRFPLQQKYSGIFLGSNGLFLTGKSSFSREERCIYPAVHRERV